jgi:hypothetical protein
MQFILLRARTSDLNHLHGDAAATPDQRRENEAVTVEALLSGAQGLSHDSYTNIFRRVFERVVEACIAAGLVGGEGFAVDASLIVADAEKQRSIPGSEWQKTRDLRTHPSHAQHRRPRRPGRYLGGQSGRSADR